MPDNWWILYIAGALYPISCHPWKLQGDQAPYRLMFWEDISSLVDLGLRESHMVVSKSGDTPKNGTSY